MNMKAFDKPISVVSVVLLIGAYDMNGKSCVFVIPGEGNPRASEIPMVEEDERAIRVLDWNEAAVAHEVSKQLAALLRKLRFDVVEAVLCDD